MFKVITSVLLVMAISGCITTQSVQDRLYVYNGQNADNFFKRYGMPYSRFDFQDKTKVYRWSSGVQSVQMPAFTSYSGSVGPAGMYSGSATTFGGMPMNIECSVDITVDEDNKIKSMRIIRDTWGMWVTSRCAEVL